MKILCTFTPCGPAYVRTGWANVLKALGHEFYFWPVDEKGAFDAFSEVEPDVFLGTTYELDRATVKCLERRPHTKVALYCSAWGPLADEMPEEYPITRVRLQEKKNVAALVEKTKAAMPAFVFCHTPDAWLDPLLGGWKETGVKVAGVLNAADTFKYLGGSCREDLACDVGFVGGWWPYKARNLAPYMLPLCHASRGLNVKIWGNQPWPVVQYLGLLDEHRERDVFCSATVCPNVSEPHSTAYGYDAVERPFKVLAAGGFCVTDGVRALQDIFPADELPAASTPQDFHELVTHFVRHPDERLPFMRKARERVLAGHTYFHRVAKMLGLMGLGGEAGRCMELHKKLVLGAT